jgi:hypothetical protein
VAARIEPNDEHVWTLLGDVKEAIAKDSLAQVNDMDNPDVLK